MARWPETPETETDVRVCLRGRNGHILRIIATLPMVTTGGDRERGPLPDPVNIPRRG